MINFIKKHIRLLVVVGIIFVIIFFVILRGSKNKKEEYTEAVVEKGYISSTVTATGYVHAKEDRMLSFGPTGKVKEVLVEEGDIVAKDHLIASLDTTILEAQVLAAQGQLSSAVSNLDKVKADYGIEIQEKTKEIQELDLKLAENEMDRTENLTENNIDKAELLVDMNEINEDAAETSISNFEEQADQSIDVAEAYEDVQGLSSVEGETWAQEQTQMTEIQNEAQKDTLDINKDVQKIMTEQSEIDLDTAKITAMGTLETIETSVEKLRKQIESTQKQIDQSKYLKGKDINGLQGIVNQASANVKMAQYNLEQAKIYAPFKCTIIDIPFEVGEYYTGPTMGSMVRIADMENLVIKVDVNEVDIFNIKLDQKVIVTFEGLDEQEFEGKVVSINPAPKVVQGVIYYEVEVEFKRPEGVYDGMTADIEIIIEENSQALFVPLIAVETRDDGSFVKVKEVGSEEVIDRQVETGIESDTSIEILSGLKEGDEVFY